MRLCLIIFPVIMLFFTKIEGIMVLLSSQCNDWALAHIERECTGTRDMLWPHMGQGMPARPSSQRGSRDEASAGMAHEEEETMTFWRGIEGWLRQRVGDGRDNFCRHGFCAHLIIIKSTYLLFSGINHCNN
jgi:hypothetical protein